MGPGLKVHLFESAAHLTTQRVAAQISDPVSGGFTLGFAHVPHQRRQAAGITAPQLRTKKNDYFDEEHHICTHCTQRVAGEGIHGLGMCIWYSYGIVLSLFFRCSPCTHSNGVKADTWLANFWWIVRMFIIFLESKTHRVYHLGTYYGT